MSDCLFCKIAAGDVSSAMVAETAELFAFEDINPQAPTHLLIIPKRHIPNNLALTDDDKTVVGEIVLLANKLAQDRGLDASGFRLVVNNGEAAGQAVFHLHFHLLGGRPFSWPPG